MIKTKSIEPNAFPEYLWAPEVHEVLGEHLTFYFVRTAYSRMAQADFLRILKESNLPVFSYLLLGQFDFLVRVWASREDQKRLEEKLLEFSHRYLGDCIPVEVKGDGVYYAWANRRPDPNEVQLFCEKLRSQTPSGRREYVSKELKALKRSHLIVEALENRHDHEMKAFTIIRNFNLSSMSHDHMASKLREAVTEFSGRRQDATLYSTRGDIHFIVRWGANKFETLVKAVSALIVKLEHTGFATLVETYLMASTLGCECENPLLLREVVSEGQPGQDTEKGRWAKVIPKFAEAKLERQQLFLSLIKTREFDLALDFVEKDRPLCEVIGSYFAESKNSFSAFLSQYYSQFETRLRNWLLAEFWPDEPSLNEAKVAEWSKLLAKSTGIQLGTDSGKQVPKLALGDTIRLAKHYRADAFDAALDRRFEDLIRLRNQVSHGTAVVDFDMFVPFLAQASACARLLKTLETKPEMPKE